MSHYTERPMDEYINLSWLNNSLLERAIRSSEQDENVQLTSYKVAPATAAGDNYSTEIYRIIVKFVRGSQPGERSLIVKALPDKEEMARVIVLLKGFPKESMVLSSIIPSMHRLLEEASPSEFPPFSPKCFHSQTSPDLIVMEDLKEMEFRMVETTLGLDMNHSLLVIRKIARYHACSVPLHEKNPKIFQLFDEDMFNETFNENTGIFFTSGLKNLAKEIENWPDYKDRFPPKLYSLAENVTDLATQILKRNDNEFNVFRHGDLWFNNMMFKYSETGEVLDVRFLDYQGSYFGSPATDIIYFLHTSVSPDLMHEHEKLVQEYYRTFKETLTLLGYGHLTPSMSHLEKQLQNKRQYAIIVCCTVLPIVLADPTHTPDIESIMTTGSSLHFSNKFKDVFKKHLLEFERKGWI